MAVAVADRSTNSLEVEAVAAVRTQWSDNVNLIGTTIGFRISRYWRTGGARTGAGTPGSDTFFMRTTGTAIRPALPVTMSVCAKAGQAERARSGGGRCRRSATTSIGTIKYRGGDWWSWKRYW